MAFFGGSFDPPHLGHLAIAQAAQQALALDTVLFAPVGAQPLKPQGSTASFAHRLAMTRLAIATQRHFALSMADAPHPSGEPNYTLETLLKLRAELPSEGTLFCLMGADSFAQLRHWRRAAEIPFAAPLIVASRPGQPLDDLLANLPDGLTLLQLSPAPDSTLQLHLYTLRNSADEQTPLYLLPDLEIEICASDIRAQIAASAIEQKLLPLPVSEYIRAHGLYQSFAASPSRVYD